VAPGVLNDDLVDGAAVYELRPVGSDPKLDPHPRPRDPRRLLGHLPALPARIEHAHLPRRSTWFGAIPLTAAVELAAGALIVILVLVAKILDRQDTNTATLYASRRVASRVERVA
jgi:hypothetical protein